MTTSPPASATVHESSTVGLLGLSEATDGTDDGPVDVGRLPSRPSSSSSRDVGARLVLSARELLPEGSSDGVMEGTAVSLSPPP